MLTQDELKDIVYYNSESGILVWNYSSGKRKKGSIAGTMRPDGRIIVRIGKKMYLAHRLIWLYVYGKFPDNCIDHINHVPSDNRIANLRDVTHTENMRNLSIRKDNTSGVVGVFWDNKYNSWCARINNKGKTIHLGYFATLEAATLARKSSLIELKYHKNHH